MWYGNQLDWEEGCVFFLVLAGRYTLLNSKSTNVRFGFIYCSYQMLRVSKYVHPLRGNQSQICSQLKWNLDWFAALEHNLGALKVDVDRAVFGDVWKTLEDSIWLGPLNHLGSWPRWVGGNWHSSVGLWIDHGFRWGFAWGDGVSWCAQNMSKILVIRDCSVLIWTDRVGLVWIM